MSNNKISLFSNKDTSAMSGVSYKAFLLKRKIIFELATHHEQTVTELSATLNVSNPTITKLISDLIAEGYVHEMGKIETAGGRRPQSYGLISNAGYFIGIDINDTHLNFALMDINKKQLTIEMKIPFVANNDNSTIDKLALQIENFISQNKLPKDRILGIGMSIRGRVDSSSGHSYNIFNFDQRPISEIISEKTGIPTIIENDTRAMAYAEWDTMGTAKIENAIFINVGKGIGSGIIIDGKPYYGKSGFSGEFGHIPFFDNQKICPCGKKGCLETEVSGVALENDFIHSLQNGASSILTEKYKLTGKVELADIIEAASKDDVLSIELITSIGEKLGRGIGVLINLFNPELVVVGGSLSAVGDYLMLPIRTALNKYSLSLVNRDSHLSLSTLGEAAGVIGAALLARKRILEN